MTEAVEGGAALAWRLLATLEGGSLVLATSALLAYTARHRWTTHGAGRPLRSVILTNSTNTLGREIKQKLESLDCVVRTVSDEATSGAEAEASKVDALVVVGAEQRSNGLDGLARLVSEDVYNNLKYLDKLAPLVRHGGYMAWACTGATSGAFGGATEAFDDAIQASLQHVAKTYQCQPVWVGRCEEAERGAELLAAALVPCTIHNASRFSIRNAVSTVSTYVGRWLKIVT